jgi:hypothetical protein
MSPYDEVEELIGTLIGVLILVSIAAVLWRFGLL